MKASSMILDLLRTYRQEGTTTANLLAAGNLFGFSDNLLRVSLSRLVSRGLVEKIQRGRYRVSSQTTAVNEFADSWRWGEKRIRPWDGQSLVLVAHDSFDSKSLWALESLGFVMVRDSLFARPDNLASDVRDQLRALGLIQQAYVIKVDKPEQQLVQDCRSAYPIDQLQHAYLDMNHKLKASLSRLDKLDPKAAMSESFLLGGKAIELLSKDPLLPTEWISVDDREQLRQTMLSYDKHGTAIWGRNLDSPQEMPAASYA